MPVRIDLPISDEAAKACVIAADRLGVEPWELAVHALAHKAGWFDSKRNWGRPAVSNPSSSDAKGT